MVKFSPPSKKDKRSNKTVAENWLEIHRKTINPKKFRAEGEQEYCHYVMIFTPSIHYTSVLLNIKDHSTNKSRFTVLYRSHNCGNFYQLRISPTWTFFQGMKRVIFFSTIAKRKFNRTGISFLLPCTLNSHSQVVSLRAREALLFRHVACSSSYWSLLDSMGVRSHS